MPALPRNLKRKPPLSVTHADQLLVPLGVQPSSRAGKDNATRHRLTAVFVGLLAEKRIRLLRLVSSP